MKSNQKKLAIKLKEATKNLSYEEKIDFLKDYFLGETCYIIGCGPSLKDFQEKGFLEKLSGKNVLTIKQAYHLCKDYSTFHFYNCCNYTDYDYNNVFVVSQSDACSEKEAIDNVWKRKNYDLNVFVGNNKDTKNLLSRTKKIESWTFNNTGRHRPWGAGIIFETVFYFAFHLGFKAIKTIGWDYWESGLEVPHFYENKEGIRNLGGQLHDEELADSLSLASAFYSFLRKNEVKLMAWKSDKCFLSDDIERFLIEEAKNVH